MPEYVFMNTTIFFYSFDVGLMRNAYDAFNTFEVSGLKTSLLFFFFFWGGGEILCGLGSTRLILHNRILHNSKYSVHVIMYVCLETVPRGQIYCWPCIHCLLSTMATKALLKKKMFASSVSIRTWSVQKSIIYWNSVSKLQLYTS